MYMIAEKRLIILRGLINLKRGGISNIRGSEIADWNNIYQVLKMRNRLPLAQK